MAGIKIEQGAMSGVGARDKARRLRSCVHSLDSHDHANQIERSFGQARLSMTLW